MNRAPTTKQDTFVGAYGHTPLYTQPPTKHIKTHIRRGAIYGALTQPLNTTAFGGTAPIMRNRRDVANQRNLEARRL